MSPLRSRRIRALGRAGAVALAAHTVGACYTNVPVSSDARPVGSAVVLDVTDRGRVRLGTTLGPSPLRVEGRLSAATDSSLTLAVTRVEGLRGESTPWSGESVTLLRDDVGLVQVRRLDRGRSGIAAAIAVGVTALVALTVSLVVNGGLGSDDPSTKPPGGGNGT